jgi:hypothetical protein
MAKERCVTIRPAWRWRGLPLRRYAEDVRRGHRLEDAMARARPAEHRFHHLRPPRETIFTRFIPARKPGQGAECGSIIASGGAP